MTIQDCTSNFAGTFNPPSATFLYCDGGRAAAGLEGEADDCVVRAIAIVSKIPYQLVHDELFRRSKAMKGRSRLARAARRNPSPDGGTYPEVFEPYLKELGFRWTPRPELQLRKEELPAGRLLVSMSDHLVALVDGVIYDTFDSSDGGERRICGYYQRHEPIDYRPSKRLVGLLLLFAGLLLLELGAVLGLLLFGTPYTKPTRAESAMQNPQFNRMLPLPRDGFRDKGILEP